MILLYFVRRAHFDDKLKNLNKKITWNKTNVLVENKFKKLLTVDLSLFCRQSYFNNNNGVQHY